MFLVVPFYETGANFKDKATVWIITQVIKIMITMKIIDSQLCQLISMKYK